MKKHIQLSLILSIFTGVLFTSTANATGNTWKDKRASHSCSQIWYYNGDATGICTSKTGRKVASRVICNSNEDIVAGKTGGRLVCASGKVGNFLYFAN